jgi:16S rRNA (cytosine1402-N4)-methyltransferase
MEQPLPLHVPVMVEEVIAWLDPQPGQTIVDGTLGGGGHTRVLAERVGPTGLVVALDRDAKARDAAEQRLAGMSVKLVAADFRELIEVLEQLEIAAVDGVLLDLGLSSDQLADDQRGFGFDSSGPLDLRFDVDAGEPAWKLIERMDATQLADLIYTYGEERYSRRIARNIVEARAGQVALTARQLADIVRRSVPRSRDSERIDPATRTFQALRIAVNDELGSLEQALGDFPACLAMGGRVAVISFHSLEDRIVKQTFRDDPRYEALVRKPIVPTETEIRRNHRARSAKMRVAQRIV